MREFPCTKKTYVNKEDAEESVTILAHMGTPAESHICEDGHFHVDSITPEELEFKEKTIAKLALRDRLDMRHRKYVRWP